uniref:Uncharacterized protein n=1 Tax=Cannabis sativa TaxID=3483 RepID=A0A803QAP0_CANSA
MVNSAGSVRYLGRICVNQRVKEDWDPGGSWNGLLQLNKIHYGFNGYMLSILVMNTSGPMWHWAQAVGIGDKWLSPRPRCHPARTTSAELGLDPSPDLRPRRFPKGSLNRSFHRPGVFSSSSYSVSPCMKIQFITSQYNTLKLLACSDSFCTFYRFSHLNDHDEEDAKNRSFDEAVELFNKREYYREELFQIVDKTVSDI